MSRGQFVLPLKHLLGWGILTSFPFEDRGAETPTYSLFSSLLGPTHSQRITLAVKPFSTSVFKDLIWILATTTKIDTKGSYIQVHTHTTELPSRPPTPWSKEKDHGLSIGNRLERHPFSGPIHSAGELLHTPKRVPTSMATVLLSKWNDTLYGVFMSLYSGTLTQRSVHPASPVLLTRNGPLRAVTIQKEGTNKDANFRRPI